jgi:hypothetical protein
MFIDEEYYLDEETRFYKEQEEKYYRLQRQEAQKHYKKKHSFEEVMYEFEGALLYRCISPYDDYLQPFPTHKRNSDLIELINEMRKKFPKEKRFSYQFLKDNWKDDLSYYDRDDWYHKKLNGEWNTGKGTQLMESFIDTVLLEYLEKTKKYKNKAKPTFTLEAPKTPIIEPKKEEPVIEEKIVNGKGRPKGSKNKKQEEMKPPTHKIDEKSIVAALQDIIWYAEGLKANEIFKYIEADESITKKIYGKLHENAGKLWDKRVCGTLHNGAKIERYYPLTPRKGYFYNGEIHTLSSLATLTGIAKQTLSYRISKGVNHIDAINKEINENMRRK